MQKNLRLLVTDQRGFVLYLSIILMGLLSIIGLGYATVARVDVAVRDSAAKERDSFYAAEAGLNVGMAEFTNLFREFSVPSSSDFTPRTIPIGNRQAVYQLTAVDSADTCSDPDNGTCYQTMPAGEKFAGLRSILYRYMVK